MNDHFLKLMTMMSDMKASDMYVTENQRITLRVEDVFIPVESWPVMTEETINDILKEILSERQLKEFATFHEMNMSFGIPSGDRFRVNVMHQRQAPAIVIRSIKKHVPEFSTLGLPETLKKIVLQKRGIVLLCGMTGSGKSTTLASLIDYRNHVTSGHIITIEDPIEYLYQHRQSIITQREVGMDTDNYHIALKNAFRQRPDVILIGEIRDRYVMEQALVAAETGQLCLSTIHATNAYQAIERILNLFEDTQVHQARINLGLNLRAIISQRLIPSTDGKLVLAFEIMLNEGYVRELILKGETAKIREVMAQNQANGMVTFDQTLLRLHAEGRITEQVAISEADLPVDMELQLRKQKVASNFSKTSRPEVKTGPEPDLTATRPDGR